MLDFFINGIVDGANFAVFGAVIATILLSATGLVIFVIDRCLTLNRYIDSPKQYARDKLKKADELRRIDDMTSKVAARKIEAANMKRSIEALKN